MSTVKVLIVVKASSDTLPMRVDVGRAFRDALGIRDEAARVQLDCQWIAGKVVRLFACIIGSDEYLNEDVS